MKGTIQKIELKDNQIRININDVWYGCFDTKLSKILIEGKTIDFAYKENGKYKNIVSAVNITSPQKTAEATTMASVSYSDKITYGNCLNCASRIHAALIGKGVPLDVSYLHDLAEKIFQEGKRRKRW